MKAMLASKWETRNESMFPFWAQPKYDGIRAIIGEDKYAYTRALKPVRNYELQSMIRNADYSIAGLDGEFVVGDPTAKDCFVRTSSAVMSFENDDIKNVKFWVFDVWNHNGDYDDRYGYLLEIMNHFPDWVVVAPNTLLHDMQMFREYEERKVTEGHEGIILRRRDKKYKFGRGTPKEGQLIKLKRFEDAEGEIVAVYEKMHNANPATIGLLGQTERSGHKENLIPTGVLGAVEVKLSPEWESKTVRIGTGFDDAMRIHFWNQRENLVGKIVKYKYFQTGSKDAPRFPVYLGIRDSDDMSSENAQGSLL